MKSTASVLSILAVTTEAGWFYPGRGWNAISNTLPGATFRKRDALPESSAEFDELELHPRGGGGGNLYSACGYNNLASKYYSYPINGFAYAAAVVSAFPAAPGSSTGSGGSGGSGSTANNGASSSGSSAAGAANSGTDSGGGSGGAGSGGTATSSAGASAGNATINSPIQQYFVNASSAYDCCAQAMQDPTSLFFFYTSNPAGYLGSSSASLASSGNGGASIPSTSGGSIPQCIITSNLYCPIQKNEVMILAASYNASAPRGTSYGNYLGNGNCGSGVSLAFNNANAAICAANSGGSQQSNPNQEAASSGAAAACAYTSPNTPDTGGANPVGSGSTAGSSQ